MTSAAAPGGATGPAVARDTFDRLEAAIVDVDLAASAGDTSVHPQDDQTSRVPGSPEPPD